MAGDIFMRYTEPRKHIESFPSPNEGQNVEPENEKISEDLNDDSVKDSIKTKPPELY